MCEGPEKGGNGQCLGGCVMSVWQDGREGMAQWGQNKQSLERTFWLWRWIEGTSVGVGRRGSNYCSTLQAEGDRAMVARKEVEWSEWIQEIFRSEVSGAGDGLDE